MPNEHSWVEFDEEGMEKPKTMRCWVILEKDRFSELGNLCREHGFLLELPGEMIKRGLAKARACNVRLGRPPRNIDLAQIRNLLAEHRSTNNIAKTLGLPRSTVLRRIRLIEGQDNNEGPLGGKIEGKSISIETHVQNSDI